ncbi:hypothetical protein TCELL_0504 [Thermogladius calderae 1633]|uniref:Uncharacterized protein n=1 Tax=Thermogladius calderae (strain DSM 22663 / VKM B-2946 / 1633) TaxID=1184251 RepID=I3TDU1_THEC1|nr:hypothetical protein TCELL_0504 [Thermogladius calderae 1633]
MVFVPRTGVAPGYLEANPAVNVYVGGSQSNSTPPTTR